MVQNKCGQFKIKKKFHIPRWTSEIFQMWLFWGKLATSMNLTHWYHSGRDMSVSDVYLNHWFTSQDLSQFASPCLWEKLSWETLSVVPVTSHFSIKLSYFVEQNQAVTDSTKHLLKAKSLPDWIVWLIAIFFQKCHIMIISEVQRGIWIFIIFLASLHPLCPKITSFMIGPIF